MSEHSKNAMRCKRYRASMDQEQYRAKERERKRKYREWLHLQKNKEEHDLVKFKDRQRKARKCAKVKPALSVESTDPESKSDLQEGASQSQEAAPQPQQDGPDSQAATPNSQEAMTPTSSLAPNDQETNLHPKGPEVLVLSADPGSSAVASSVTSDTPSPKSQDKCSCPFSTKQALHRSIKRAEATLPKDTEQRVFVLSNIVKSLTPTKKSKFLNNLGKKSTETNKGRPLALSEEHKTFLLNYLEQPGISYTLPGKKDQKYIGKESGEKIYKTKHYLLWTLRDLYQMMNRDDDLDAITMSFKSKFNAEIKFSTLHRFIKGEKHILYQQDIPEVSCLCQKCENLELLIQGIKGTLPEIELPKDAKSIADSFNCNKSHRSCSYGECVSCPTYESSILDHCDEIQYFQWVTGEGGRRFPEKVPIVSTGEETKKVLDDQIAKIKVHSYLMHTQYKKYQDLKDNLKSNVIIVHVDFSENYDNKQQHAIQSAYFGYQSFSLYTVCVYHMENDEVKTQSYAFVTETTEHSSTVVFGLNRYLLQMLKSKFKFDTVHFFSDGCSAQFRSKHSFMHFTKYDPSLKCYWNYFETSHGKGPVDGVGGTVKSVVYRKVMSKQVVIQSPKHFAEYANDVLKGIDVLFVGAEEMSVDESEEDSVVIPGTLKVRYVERIIQKGSVLLKFSTESPISPPDSHIEPFRTMIYPTTSHKCTPNMDPGDQSEQTKDEIGTQPSVGQWYAVYFDDFSYWFIGMVIELSENSSMAKLDFLQQNGLDKNLFNRNKSDVSWVDVENIFYKLEAPYPLSFSRTSTLIMNDRDFREVKRIFAEKFSK